MPMCRRLTTIAPRGNLPMRRHLTIIAILAAVLAAISATPASAFRSCGIISASSVRVTIDQGRVSCAEARAAIRLWEKPGPRIEHGPRNGSFAQKSWTMRDGWTCKEGTGGGVCSVGGSGPLRVVKPRAVIDYSFVP